MTEKPRATSRLVYGVTMIVAVVVLGLGAEGLTRFGFRLKTGDWPITEAVRFDHQIHSLLKIYRRHPFLNTAAREDSRAEAFGKVFTMNSLGYRSPERPLKRTVGTTRVLCSGGSTTFDILAANDSKTWPWRLEAKLAERNVSAEVFNAGFPGWTSQENLISLAIRDLELRPDILILFQGINDLQPAAHRPFDPQYEHGHAELVVRSLGFDLRRVPWYEHSVLVEKARDAVFGKRNPWQRLEAPPPTKDRMPALPEQAVSVFERNVRSIVTIAAANDIKSVLVTQPLRLRKDHREADRAYLAQWIRGLLPDEAPAQLSRLNDALKKVALTESVIVADAANDIEWSDEDFRDPMHFSPSGSEIFSQYLSRIVANLQVGPEGDASDGLPAG